MTEYQKWLDQNPLRKFREKNDIARTRLAGHLSVSINSVQFWENGTSEPNDENIEKVAIVMGTNPKKLRAEWNEWKEKKPKIKLGG